MQLAAFVTLGWSTEFGTKDMMASQTSASACPHVAKGVQVVVRVRPMLAKELKHDNAVEVLSDKDVVAFKQDAEFASTYDHVHGVSASQQDVYTTSVQGGVKAATQGFNCTVFAYGQTGTGKTYTMMGPPGIDLEAALDPAKTTSHGTADSRRIGPDTHHPEGQHLGVVPRAAQDMFRMLRAKEVEKCIKFNVSATYLEIYNEGIYDLLQAHKKGARPSSTRENRSLHRTPDSQLDVREDKQRGVFVPGASTVLVNGMSDLIDLLKKGARHRAVRHTDMNQHSSRSHAILQLVIEQTPDLQPGHNPSAVPEALRSKLSFVDLAGSERWSKDETSMLKARCEELTAINSSLSALATVVAALTQRGPSEHVPYRDSKLTHLLQDSLGGNCSTTIIATVSPSVVSFGETVSTLKFADRAKAISNNPVVNTSRDFNSVLALKEREIGRLRHLLATMMQQAAKPGVTGEDQDVGKDTDITQCSGYDPGLLVEIEQLKASLEVERKLRLELELQLRSANTGKTADTAADDCSDQCASTTDSAVQNTGAGTGVNHARMQHRRSTPDIQPFNCVMSRRAELGFTSPNNRAGQETTRCSSRGSNGSPASWARASTYNHLALDTSPRRSSTISTRQRSARQGSKHTSVLEYNKVSIQEKMEMLARLEEANRQKAAAIVAAGRHARMAASPPRLARPKQRNCCSNSRTASPPLIDALSCYRSSVSIPTSPMRCRTPNRCSRPSSRCSNSQQPDANRQETCVKTAAPVSGRVSIGGQKLLSPHLKSSIDGHMVASSQSILQPRAYVGWGRSAILRSSCDVSIGAQLPTACIATQPSVTGTMSTTGPAVVASDTTPLACTAVSATSPPSNTLSAPTGWGRSALLRMKPGSSPGPETASLYQNVSDLGIPLTAPSTAGTTTVGGLEYTSPSSPKRIPGSLDAGSRQQSPARLDKGSLIYIFGSTTNSLRAKALARAST